MPPRKQKPLATWIYDTREQWPYEMAAPTATKFADGGSYRDGLGEGDYAIELDGERLSIRIERKSLADYMTVVGRNRERFEAELGRLCDYDKAYVVIDATVEQIRKGYDRSLVSGEAAFGSMIHWMSVYGIPFFPAGNHRAGAIVCRRLLEEFAWHRWLEMQGAVEGADAGDA